VPYAELLRAAPLFAGEKLWQNKAKGIPIAKNTVMHIGLIILAVH
jgi:hypothetical protein